MKRSCNAVTAIACGLVLTACSTTASQLERNQAAGELPIAALASQVASSPRDSDAHLELARAWDRAAGLSPGNDEYRELASTGYRSALRLAPDDYLANMLAGRSEFAAGRFDAAQSLFAAAVVSAPDDATALLVEV